MMRTFITTVAVLAAILYATPSSALTLRVDELVTKFRAAIPHNEPDVFSQPRAGDIARYEFRNEGRFTVGRVGLEINVVFWGAQPWQPASVVGSGLAAWAGSRWDVKSWAMEYTAEAEIEIRSGWSVCAAYRSGDRIPYYLTAGMRKRWR